MAKIMHRSFLGAILICATLTTIILLLPGAKAFAESGDDWQAFINGDDNTFAEGWEDTVDNGWNVACRWKHIDDYTILEEIYGTGEYSGLTMSPEDGEDLIIHFGGSFTSIPEEVFYTQGNRGAGAHLIEVSLTDSIEDIGDRAFSGCVELATIDFSENLTTIGEEAFYGCYSLTEIDLPPKLKSIGTDAFNGCERITSIVTPSSTKSVSDDAFRNCKGLTSVTFYGDNAKIDECLYECPNIKTLTIGKGVKTISHIHNDFKKLETISLNTNTIYEMDGGLFLSDDTTATKIIFTGTGTVKNLNLSRQESIEEVVIEDGVKGIGEEAFGFLENVEKITIPASVRAIGAYAFMDCASLKTLIIGAGVKKLGAEMASGCYKLKTITVKSKQLKKKSVSGCLTDSKVKTVKVNVGSESDNAKYVKKYSKIFTKNNAGRKATVK